jgi:hypothetical protein
MHSRGSEFFQDLFRRGSPVDRDLEPVLGDLDLGDDEPDPLALLVGRARATPAAAGGTVFGEDGREALRNAMEHCEVTLHGRRIGYRSTGSGPLLVLIHGIAGTSATRLCTRLRVAPASPPSGAGTGA